MHAQSSYSETHTIIHHSSPPNVVMTINLFLNKKRIPLRMFRYTTECHTMVLIPMVVLMNVAAAADWREGMARTVRASGTRCSLALLSHLFRPRH